MLIYCSLWSFCFLLCLFLPHKWQLGCLSVGLLIKICVCVFCFFLTWCLLVYYKSKNTLLWSVVQWYVCHIVKAFASCCDCVCFQSVGDVLQERFAVEMKCNTALRLAALHMHERLDSCGQTRASIKSITWVICVCVRMSLKGHTGRTLLPWPQHSSLEVLWDFDHLEVQACSTAAITVICGG